MAPLLFSNVGNMGLPVSLYAFGQAGFAYAITIMVTMRFCSSRSVPGLPAPAGNPLRSARAIPDHLGQYPRHHPAAQ